MTNNHLFSKTESTVKGKYENKCMSIKMKDIPAQLYGETEQKVRGQLSSHLDQRQTLSKHGPVGSPHFEYGNWRSGHLPSYASLRLISYLYLHTRSVKSITTTHMS